MQVSVTDAAGQLKELVYREEACDEVVHALHGQATVKLDPVRRQQTIDARRKTIVQTQAAAPGKQASGPSAARSQDFLYGCDGMPK